MKILGSNPGLQEIQLGENGPIKKRDKDGTFHVDDALGKQLVKTGDYAATGTTFRGARGYVCNSCYFTSLFRDKCGKCGSTDLTPEE
jgi:hypothetical protein